MKRKIKGETKELIIKVLIVFSCIFETMIFLIPVAAAIFDYIPSNDLINDERPLLEPFYSLWIVAWILSGFFVIAFLLSTILLGPDERTSKAEAIDLPFDDYDSLFQFVKTYADNHSFINVPAQSRSSSVDFSVFIKSTGWWEETCIALVRINSSSDKIEKIVNDCISDSLAKFYGSKRITNSIYVLTIFCVDFYGSQFRKIANRNMQQGLKNGRLAVVISFDKKKMFVARHNDGFAEAKYNKMRKLFLEIMNIKGASKRRNV